LYSCESEDKNIILIFIVKHKNKTSSIIPYFSILAVLVILFVSMYNRRSLTIKKVSPALESTPSATSIIDPLNLVNGVFTSPKRKELEQFKLKIPENWELRNETHTG
jgi:hypothetical protein